MKLIMYQLKQKTLYLSLKTIKSLNLFKQTTCKPEKNIHEDEQIVN